MVLTEHFNSHCLIDSPGVHPSWVSIGRIDAEAETAVLWPPHANS